MKEKKKHITYFLLLSLGTVLLMSGCGSINEAGVFVGISKNTTNLNLSNQSLTSLPSEIGEYSQVTMLSVNGNDLTGTLPGEIRKMTKLEILDAHDNRLTGIPAKIGQLANLEILDLSDNLLDTYPNELANLKQLTTLNIRNNFYTKEQVNKIKELLPNTDVISN